MKRLLIILLLGFSTSLFAQNTGKVIIVDEEEKRPVDTTEIERLSINKSQYISISLTDYFGLEPTYSLAYSYPIKEGSKQLVFELGYVTFNKTYNAIEWGFDNNISYHGVKAKAQYRNYYMTKSKIKAINRGYHPFSRDYVAFELFYKYGNSWYQNEVERLNGLYWENVGIQSHKHILAGQVLLGGEVEMFNKSSTITDWYMGIGLRYKYIKCNDENIQLGDKTPFFYDGEEIPLLITASFGIKLGFKVK